MLKRFTGYKRLLALAALSGGAAPVERTATGNPLTFLTDLARPLKSLVANFLPVQASGTPSPENILPITGWTGAEVDHTAKNYFTKNVNQSFDRYVRLDLQTPIPAGSYVFTATVESTTTAQNCGVLFAKVENVGLVDILVPNHGRHSIPVTFTDDINYIYLYADKDWGAASGKSAVFSGILLTEQTQTVYPVVFPALGKNLFNGQYVKGLITGNVSQGYTWNSNGTNANSAIIPCEPNTTYTVKKHTSSNRFSVATCPVYPTQGQTLTLVVENALLSEYTFTTGADAHYIVVYVSTGTEQAEPDMMVNTGSYALPYEPFNNTLFGGYYNLITGELWGTYESVDMGSVEWVIHNNTGTRQAWKAVFNRIKKGKFGTAFDGFSEAFKSVAYTATWTPYIMAEDESKNIYICFEPSAYSTSEEVQTALDGILFVYPLAEPVLITTMTPKQITALLGDNTIWSDADGSMTAVYLVSAAYADSHPVGGLGSGLLGGGFGSGTGEPDEPGDPDEPGEPDQPDEQAEPDQPADDQPEEP